MTLRPAFVFDPDRCTSCEACRVACGIENGGGHDLGWRSVTTFNPSRHPALPTQHLSLACNHCDVPACALGCPANAYDVHEATGAVLLDPAKCIGCRYCSWVCPYDAPKYDAQESIMRKCTFCAPRLEAGGQPACTAACPTGSLSFGTRERGEPEPIYHGLGVTGLGPSLRVIPPRGDAPPAMAIDALTGIEPSQPVGPRKITVRSEWTLLLFSLVMPLLVGWLGGSLVHVERAPDAIVFAALGVLVLALSTAHLGRPLRAWRAVLNVRHSWLSREIVFANVFLGSGFSFLLLRERWIGAAAVVAGFALCVSIDGVYRAIPRIGVRRAHSAEAVVTAALWLGIFGSLPWIAWMAALVKALLFARRFHEGALGAVGGVRLLALAGAVVTSVPWPIAAGLALVGEAIDRASFYDELEPATPARRMAAEMRARSLRHADGRL